MHRTHEEREKAKLVGCQGPARPVFCLQFYLVIFITRNPLFIRQIYKERESPVLTL